MTVYNFTVKDRNRKEVSLSGKMNREKGQSQATLGEEGQSLYYGWHDGY
jgi:hypothetical protein